MNRYIILGAALAIFVGTSSAFAQQPADGPFTQGADQPISQTFRINVPQNITITCPDVLVELVHDGNDTDQVFPPQTWEVKGNSPLGVTVSFSLDAPFTKGGSTLDHQRRDASLSVTPANELGPASWNSVSSTIQTNIFDGVSNDLYTATSNGVGRSDFILEMTFVNSLNGGGFGTYESGDYETTVTGEVTEN